MGGIRVENLSKAFGGFQAVDRVSFEVEEGELVALLGPSGSGKSTILRAIAGLETPDVGKILLGGRDVTNERVQERAIGFVFQHYALFKHMTVEKNIAFGLQVLKRGKDETREKVSALIKLVKLDGYEHHYPFQLSGGQRQRVALARALAPAPSILLLDEPFGSLDAKVRKNLAHWIRDLHKRIGVTGIFVTHDQNEAMEIADKIILVNRGRVEQVGTPREIYESPGSKFVASFVGNVNIVDSRVQKEGVFIVGTGDAITHPGGLEIPGHGEAVLLVRPEEVTLSREKGDGGSLCGVIDSIDYRGSFYELEINLGANRVKASIDKKEFQEKSWSRGEKVYTDFRRYKLFEAVDGHDNTRSMLKQYGYIE